MILPMQPVDHDKDGPNGPSRPDSRKNIKDDGKDPNLKISGHVVVQASWTYPCIEGRGVNMDFRTWLDELEKKAKASSSILSSFTRSGKSLRTYQAKIQNKYKKLSTLVDKEVEKGVLKGDNFFKECEIDKNDQAVFKEWFKENAATDLEGRAKQEENRHTGTLNLKIIRAEMLRKSDAKKFKECDPQAFVYVRNDFKGAWKKYWIMRTKQIKDNRNPQWDHDEMKNILNGKYEAQFRQPPEGWGSEAAEMLTRGLNWRGAREMDEQKRIDKVKRYGADGLKLSFMAADVPVTSSAASDFPEGQNHQVKVYLTDTIREFKEKVLSASHQEAEHWKSSKGPTSEQYFRYEGIEIGHRHLVLAYVPSARVTRMAQTKGTKTDEYARVSRLESLDPNNWHPMDMEKSFKQYVSMYGFGRQKQMLKIVRATEAYKAVNLAYKHWDAEKKKVALKDRNEASECFGWSQYVHKEDAKSIEWRRASVGKLEKDSADAKTHFKVKWYQQPNAIPPPSDPALAKQKEQEEKDREAEGLKIGEEKKKIAEVLLNPRVPKIKMTASTPEKMDVLKQAKALRQAGKSDWDIEMLLNRQLKATWEAANLKKDAKDKTIKPQELTVDEIRAYLNEIEEEASKKIE